MANYKEIVTKTVIGKGKKTFTTTKEKELEMSPSTILGCWVINHKFQGNKINDKIKITGSYDVNIWYSYDNDTKTDVIKEQEIYEEIVNIKNQSNTQNEEIIVRSLKQPTCVKIDISGKKVIYTIEKELGIELVGDEKVRIAIDESEDSWDEIIEESTLNEEQQKQDIDEIKEDYLEDSTNKQKEEN